MSGTRTHRARMTAGALAIVAAVAGCGGGATDAPTAAPDGGSGAFPVAVEHRYGSTEIPAEPQRVVTVGLTDQDTVLAFGVVPVALTDWFGDQPNGVWPWAQEQLGDAEPVVMDSAEINVEQVAAAEPDLILAVNSGLTEAEYATLSQIAPTVAPSGDFVDFGTPWQEQTRIVGAALGRAEQAEELVAGTEAQFAAARAANPEFAGASGVIALTGEDGNHYPYGPQDARTRFLTDLGFTPSAEIAELAGDDFFTTISAERFDLLNADVLVWIAESQVQIDALRSDPAYAAQPVVAQGRDVFPAYDPLGAALSYNNVLSLPFALEGVTPLLKAAVDGDPATAVPAA